jgi:stalled ribosome rescue protein Dom34
VDASRGEEFAQELDMAHHAAVWIDHQEAKIFHIDSENVDEATIRAPHHHVRRHPTTTAERAHPADASQFFHAVEEALRGDEEVLLVGPGSAKLELLKHAQKHDQALTTKIVGVETVDHPTDGQLLKYARTYFRAADRMR